MTTKARHFDYRPDEYVTGVGGVLSFAEQGVYWMVCTLIMSRGGPIEEDIDRLAHLGKMRRGQVKAIIDVLVERGKLHRKCGQLVNNRAVSEVEHASKRIAIARENGSKGGRPPSKHEEKQAPEKPGGSSGEKLTTNDQPPTDISIADAMESPRKPGPDDLRAEDFAADAPEGVDVEDQLRRFHDWRKAKGKRFKDYRAAFRNWLRKAGEFRSRDGPSKPGGVMAAYGELAARMGDG